MSENGASNPSKIKRLISAWLDVTREQEVSLGLDHEGVTSRAQRLREEISSGRQATQIRIDPGIAETLYALTSAFRQESPSDQLVRDLSTTFEFVESLVWPEGELGGREQILSQLAFSCWRAMSLIGRAGGAQYWLERFSSVTDGTPIHDDLVLAISHDDHDFTPFEPEDFLCLTHLLWSKIEASPMEVKTEAEFLFCFLEANSEIAAVDRHFFLGEFALICGTACRALALRDRASEWFRKSESCFRESYLSDAHLARIAYQQLALKLEKRNLSEIADLAAQEMERLAGLGLPEEALKCRFLQGHALKETGRLAEATRIFRGIRDDAEGIGSLKLAGIAADNLFQIHAFLGEIDDAHREAEYAIPLLRRFNSRIGIAKIQVGLGYLFRSERNLQASIAAFREAQNQFAEIGLHADVAATHLVLADLLLDANQPAQAEWEIRAALPVIDELKLVPEGIAALSLLRDSVRRRQIDRQALRSLNGYFEELKS